jgi:DNA polymerase-3 subunit gamma/tau
VSVIEIDGASNNGVGDIRELKKKVTTYGMHGRFKIYIIDEAQMLTKPAFNALLKTLEEPPSHVKFILCTTELDKIPKTIRSRCQLFTFYPIADDVMAKQLENVMALESVKFEADLPIELAKMANGSLRDSLTLLDQVINTGESPLTTTTLERFFGKPKKSRVQAILVALGQGDVGKVGRETAQLNRKGFNEYFVVATLIDAMHEIIPTRLNDPEKLETIVDIIIELEALSRSVRTSESPAALLKATLLKIALRRRK